MNISKIAILFLAALFLNINVVNAQTQEEIERLLNGGTTESQVETKEKKEKEPKAKKEKVEKEKKEKEPKAKKEKKAKPEKSKAQKSSGNTKEKNDKQEKAKKEKSTTEDKAITSTPKTSEVKPSSTQNNSPSRTRPSSSEDKPLRSWSIGVYGGLTNPVTDIRYKNWFGVMDPRNENQWNAGLKVTKMFDAAFGLQWNSSYSVVQGVFDANSENESNRDYLIGQGFSEGVYFKSNVISTSLNVYWNISNTVFGPNRHYKAKLKGRDIKPRRFSLYMYSGVGATWFDPHVMMAADKRPIDLAGVNIANKNMDETLMAINIPLGIGTKFKLAKAVDLSVEYVFNFMFTDKLDGYVNNNPERIKNDMYTNLNVGLEFKLGTKKKSKEHVEWVNPLDKVYADLTKIDDLDRKMKKLTSDSDDDGVSDWFDKDSETPEGITVDGSGRALDSDGDGIPDRIDMEPFSDKDAEVDEFGISLDDDNDGVPNHKDEEPNTKEGAFVNFQGKAIEGNVKPAMARGSFFPSIYFDTDKATIKREYESELFIIAKNIINMEGVQFLLSGHCDERGSEEYNLKLGERRAVAVKSYLVENYEIDASRLQTISKGKSGITAPRFSINRRVEIMIIEK